MKKVLFGFILSAFSFGLLALLVVPTIIEPKYFPKEKQAALDIELLSKAIYFYDSKIGNLPSEAEGLNVLLTSDSIKRLPEDPWGDSYVYNYISEDTFLVYSKGYIVHGESSVMTLYVRGENGFCLRKYSQMAHNKPVKLAHAVRWGKYSLAPSALSPASICPLPESYMSKES